MLTRSIAALTLLASVSCAAGPYSARAFAGTLDFLYRNEAPLSPPRIDGDSHIHLWKPLVELAARQDVAVLLRPYDEGVWGLYWERFRVIAINSSLSPNARVATLVHELAHVLEPAGLTSIEADAFAETVSVLVMRELGLDIRFASAGYFLGGSRAPEAGAIVRRYAPVADVTAAFILKELQK